MVDERLSKLFEEARLDRNVLDSLLVLSTEGMNYETNTIKESILRAAASGLLNYLGSDKKSATMMAKVTAMNITWPGPSAQTKTGCMLYSQGLRNRLSGFSRPAVLIMR